ncbi:MAG: glycosyltransferase [Lachnospiraceae bacterium]
MSSQILYLIGFILVVFYILMGFDDFIWDIYAMTRRGNYKKARLDFKKIRTSPPKLIAVMIGAWSEADVIGRVIDNLLASIQYPKSMYHLFVGVYPNDPKTMEIVAEIADRVPNVHMVINCKPGPTTKAQNLNHVISQIKEYEKQKGWKFQSVTIHDAEDVVHPYELMVTNYMIEQYDALQFPVFPLMQMPKITNFLKTLTVGTYADEFAENHFITMVGRCSTGAFVPSAGTGLALSRRAIDSFGSDDILPDGSLTEDYRLSLTLFENKSSLYYVLDSLPRVTKDKKIVYDFVTTRSMFPTSFRAAVKQKTRWIMGITMQSVEFKEIFAKNGLPFMGRYSIYRDLKAKVGNLLVFVGYPVLAYFFVSLFIPLAPIYPFFSLSWYLSLLVTFMMIERQISRGVAIFNVYGMRSVFFACLLPPIIPIRIIWGNIINLTATLNAYKSSLSGNRRKKKEKTKKKSVVWSKTEHTFLSEDALSRYRRTFGDVLIEKGFLEPERLKHYLLNKPDTIYIGEYLLEQKAITEQQMLEVLAHVKGIQFVNLEQFSGYDLKSFAHQFDKDLLQKLMVLPLICWENTYVIVYCEKSPSNAQSILREKMGIEVVSAFTVSKHVQNGIDFMYGETQSDFVPTRAFELLSDKKINAEQYILLCNYAAASLKPVDEILVSIGLDCV